MAQPHEQPNCYVHDVASDFPRSNSRLKTSLKSPAESDSFDLPVKKRRRSSGRRKSLLETLHSVANSPVKSLSDETGPPILLSAVNSKSEILKTNESTQQYPTNSATKPFPEKKQSNKVSDFNHMNSLPLSASDTLQHETIDESMQLDDVLDKPILEWYNALGKESNEWNTLLSRYKLADTKVQQPSIVIKSESSIDAVPTQVDISNICTDFESDLNKLQQRFSHFNDEISACLKNVSSVRIDQENRLKRTMDKIIASYKTDFLDPKLLIENIFSFKDTFQDPLLSSYSVT